MTRKKINDQLLKVAHVRMGVDGWVGMPSTLSSKYCESWGKEKKEHLTYILEMFFFLRFYSEKENQEVFKNTVLIANLPLPMRLWTLLNNFMFIPLFCTEYIFQVFQPIRSFQKGNYSRD